MMNTKILLIILSILTLILLIILFFRKEKYDCESCHNCMRKHPGLGTINLQSTGCYDVDTCSMCGTPEDISGNIVNAIYTPKK